MSMQADYKNKGLTLLKKGQKGIIHAIFSRFGLMLLLLVIQILLFFMGFQWFKEFRPHYYSAMQLFSFIVGIWILNSRINPTAKITWLIVIALMPVFGVLLFLYMKSDIGHRVLKRRVDHIITETKEDICQDRETMEHLSQDNEAVATLAHYIGRSSCHPVYDRTAVTYFPLGEDKFEEMLKQLQAAEHFIFMEYFIVAEGLMWGRVLEILAQKAAQGVEIRFMYDGSCEFALLPRDYPKRLRALGICCKVFAPVTPFISTHYNYRDHRKILVIDGHTAFTGGVNLADEYINREVKFGHWKDTAVMVKGEAVKSFTLMFLQTWGIDEREQDYAHFLSYPALPVEKAKGYVIPYGDCPLDDEKLGERVYMDILNRSLRYVHIMTPYLILDDITLAALKYAAKRGVETVIIMPHIPDKLYAYLLARSYYEELLKAGVRIFEYTPGFVHAKMFVCDDEEAVVGTINLDFRSLYLHFECAAYFCQSPVVPEVERDMQETLLKCEEITLAACRSYPFVKRFAGKALRLFAPLM